MEFDAVVRTLVLENESIVTSVSSGHGRAIARELEHISAALGLVVAGAADGSREVWSPANAVGFGCLTGCG
jgi:hypothetical protein